MARKPMITRTITTTRATFLCLDLETGESYNETFNLPRTYKTESDMLKAVHTYFDLTKSRPVHVVDEEIITTLYGMPEIDFVKYAEIIEKPVKDVDNE